MSRWTATVAERFWSKVIGGEVDGCWLWTGAKAGGGYGDFYLGPEASPRKTPAHRWAFEALRGEIPAGLLLDHLCRNRACVNPWHLDPVTPLVNVQRGVGHGSEAACPQGHPYDDDNTYRAARGDRQCRTCMRLRNRAASRRRRNTPAQPNTESRTA